jgi:acyl-CoA synthetase (AMP-forming)/AMP-acid ligase II
VRRLEFNLADLFECVADHVPEREALVAGATRLTYRELDERATRLAHGLKELGVRPHEHVGLLLANGAEYLEAVLACYKLRAVPVNINHRYVEDELAYLFDDADLVALISHRSFAPRVDAVRTRSPDLRVVVEVGDASDAHGANDGVPYEKILASGSPARDFPPRSADDRYILYTGGTTGLPRGVVWRQEDIFFAALGGGNPGGPRIERPEDIGPSVVANPAGRVRPFLTPGSEPPDFVSLGLGPLMHAGGQWSALGTLLGGGRAVIYTDAHMDMTEVLRLIERERIVALNLVGDPSGRPLLAALRDARDAYDTSSLLMLGSGGSMLSADVKHGLFDALPTLLAIIEGIGSSESPAQAVSVTNRAGAPTTQSLRFAAKAETMVVDDGLRPIAPGSGKVGRLATRGYVPVGYYGDPERTARTLVEIDGHRWVLPGDMATIDADGTVELLGRGSLCINTGGEKVYPEEVEAVLVAHPKVADAVVVGAPDEQWGQRVVAVVQPARADDPPDLDELRAHCAGRLAGYKAPRTLHVVKAVQRNPAGKADYGWATAIANGD